MKILKTKNSLYLLLGLGIGIVVSSLFFLFFPAKQSLTKQEIVQRATELGMITEQTYKETKTQLEQLQRDKLLNQFTEKKNNMLTVLIPVGTNSSQIAKILAEYKVINNIETFHMLVDILNADKKFIAGTYQLEEQMDMGELILLLTGMKNKKN
jgi:hypothetical protein